MTYREATHQSQQKNRDPEFEFKTVKDYLVRLKTSTDNFTKNLILNMDETPLYFDMSSSRTIDFLGNKTIDSLNSGHDKNRFSLVLTISANGTLLPPAVIFKGLKKTPNCTIPEDVFVYTNESGTMTSALMQVTMLLA